MLLNHINIKNLTIQIPGIKHINPHEGLQESTFFLLKQKQEIFFKNTFKYAIYVIY